MQYRRIDNTPYRLSGGMERLRTAVHTGAQIHLRQVKSQALSPCLCFLIWKSAIVAKKTERLGSNTDALIAFSH